MASTPSPRNYLAKAEPLIYAQARYAMTSLLANDEARRLRVLRHEYQTNV